MKWLIIFLTFQLAFIECLAQPTKPFLTLNTEMHTASINSICTDSAGLRILTCSTDKTAKLWDAETGSLIQSFRIPIDEGNEGMLSAGAISPDGRLVVLGGWTGYTWDKSISIYIFDVNANSLKKRISGLRDVVTDLEFSFDGHFMVATLDDGKGIKVFETGGWGVKTSPSLYLNCSGRSMDAAFDRTGRLAVACKGGSVWVYSPAFKLIKIMETKTGKKPNSVAFSPDGTMLAVGYEDSYKIQVFDSKTFELLYEPDVSGADSLSGHLINVSFSSDGMYLVAGGSYSRKAENAWWRQIRIWSNQGRGKFMDFPAGRNIIHKITPMPDNSVIFCGGNPDFGRMRMDGTRLFFKNSETNSYTAKDRTQFKTNMTGSIIGVTPFGASPLTFSVEDRALMQKDYQAGEHFNDNYSGIKITDWGDDESTEPKLNSKGINFLRPNEACRSVDISKDAGKIVFGTIWGIHCCDPAGLQQWTTPSPSANSVKISGDGKVAIAGCDDGTLRWYNMTDGSLLFSLFLHPDNKRWVLWSPKGYFDCSQGADELIGWHVNQGADKEALYFPASKFFEKFYTPNLGSRLLAGEEITGSDVKMASLQLPPLVKITSPNSNVRGFKPINSMIQSELGTIDIAVDVTDQGGGIDEILLYNNGKLVQTTEKGFRAGENRGFKTTKIFTINLTSGENRILVTAFNAQRTEAIADELRINFMGIQTEKSNLWLFVIGINQYKNSKYNLNFAVADARGFKQQIEQGGTGIFNTIKTTFLTNEEATKPRILKEINNVKAQAKQEDVFIFYYAGHGVMSGEQVPQFYLIPHDVVKLYGNDQSLKTNAISASELKMISAEIKSQKQLFILDACQSGGATGMLAARGAAEEKAVNQLARSTGTYWLAASGSEQFAGEFAQLGHGLFTYCILEGLTGKADGQSDKKITVQELSSYLSDQVPLLSKQYKGSAQYPNAYGYGQDFPIIILK